MLELFGVLRVVAGPELKTIKGQSMFFLYFNKLGWPGSILLSIVVTLVLVLAIRLLSG